MTRYNFRGQSSTSLGRLLLSFVFVGCAVALTPTASAQVSGQSTTQMCTAPAVQEYASLLRAIAERSSQLNAAQKGHEAAVKGFRTELAPDDPEVALEYYFDKETRYEIAIEQSFDFPTVYHQRNKIAGLQSSRSSEELLSARRSIMTTISDNYLSVVYNSQRAEILRQRREQLEKLVELYVKGVDQGLMSSVDLESAKLLLVGVQADVASVESELLRARSALRQLNGGQEMAAVSYPQFEFTGTEDEFVQAAMRSDYDLRAVELDTMIAGRMLKLSRNQWLPRIKVGYKLEMSGTTPSSALLAGLSIPLWQNSGKVRHAKALGVASRAAAESATEQARVRLLSLFQAHNVLARNLKTMMTTMSKEDYAALTQRAVEAGQLSAITQLLGMAEWYDAQDRRAQLQYEVAQIGAAMMLCLL